MADGAVQLSQLAFTFFNAEIAARYLPDIARGMGVTALLSLAVVAAGVALGLALAVLRSLPARGTRWTVIACADVLRSLPPLVIIIVLFFGFPFLQLPMSSFTATWLALTLVLAAYAEESIWAGMAALHAGSPATRSGRSSARLQPARGVVPPCRPRCSPRHKPPAPASTPARSR